MKPYAVRSMVLPKIRTSCPTVSEPDPMMANMVSMADSTRFNAGCGSAAHRHRRVCGCGLGELESGVSSARDKTELAEALVEMFLPQLLSTSVTRDHDALSQPIPGFATSTLVEATRKTIRS